MNRHQRKCHDCGNIAIHEDDITPWVLCSKCGSQDTRKVRVHVAVQPAVEPIPARWRVLSVEWKPADDDGPERTAVTVQGTIEPVRNGDEIIYVRKGE